MGDMRPAEAAVLAVVVLSLIAGAWLYPKMPERMASHWNAKDQVDGYMPRFWGVFLMPLVALLMLVLFIIIPRIDPLREHKLFKLRHRHYCGVWHESIRCPAPSWSSR